MVTGKEVRWIPIGVADPIADDVGSLPDALPFPLNRAIAREIGATLRRLVLAPVRAAAPGTGRILLVPDGDLRTLPWAAWSKAAASTWPKARIESTCSVRAANGSRTRVPAIRENTSSPPRTKSNRPTTGSATSRPCEIVAGGGRRSPERGDEGTCVCDPEPANSALGYVRPLPGRERLGEHLGLDRRANEGPSGRLNAAEMAGLDLRGTSLVVLSACESAGREASFADGLRRFQRSLAVAGARTQILSLWRIGDEATAEFMSRFYRALVSGETKAEALRQAQRSFIAEGRPAAEWAAFAMFGDPGPLGE